MTTTFENKQETFNSECRLINLKYEYQGYTGDEQWAIVSELTEQEIFLKYPEEAGQYVPFVLLSVEQGEVIYEAQRNDHKFAMRESRSGCCFDTGDNEFEVHHPECINADSLMDEILLRDDICRLRKLLSELPEVQKRRIIKYYFYEISSRKIAQQEGVNYSAVDKSIASAIAKLKKFF